MDTSSSLLENLFSEDLYQIPGKALVIIPTKWEALTPEDVALLLKILGSVKLNLDSVQIISKASFTLDALKVYSLSRIISFGANLQPPIKPYENTRLGKTLVICADSLGTLDDTKKRNLWLALKQMFSTT